MMGGAIPRQSGSVAADSRGGRLVQTCLAYLRREPDVLVLLLWAAVVAGFACTRREFIGDGVRHLPHIVSSRLPALGEPRWLFFPALLFAVVRPFVAVGVASDVAGAIKPFLALSFVAALAYMVALRECLRSRGISAPVRAAALALAGFSAPMLILGTDIAEPLIAAAIVILGLAYAATASQDTSRSRRAVLVAVGAVAVAALIYQGVIVGLLLIPCVVPWKALLDRRTIAGTVAIAALIPVVMLVAMRVQGDTVRHGLERVVFQYDNPLYRTYLGSSSPIARHLVAATAGPAQGVVPVPHFTGMRAVISTLKDPATTLEGVGLFALLAFGLAVILVGIATTFRARDWAVLLAFASVFVLPLVRDQFYSYIKFYVLLPAVLALAASHVASTRAGFPALIAAAVIVAALNCTFVGANVMKGRDLAREMVPIYERAGRNACWVNSGWGPPLGQRWPGSGCGVLGILSGGTGRDGVGRLDECLQACFCGASSVLTDDLTLQSRSGIAETVSHFEYPPADLDGLLWRPELGYPLEKNGTVPVLEYSPAAQQRICGQLRATSTAARTSGD